MPQAHRPRSDGWTSLRGTGTADESDVDRRAPPLPAAGADHPDDRQRQRTEIGDELVPPHGRRHQQRWVHGTSMMTAIVSLICVNASGPTLPSVSTTRAGDTARTCWHCAAEGCSSPLVGSGSRTISV